MESISKLLSEGVESGHFPGVGYAIIYKEGFINIDFVGYRQLEPNQILCTGDEIYDCASLTKVVSTTTLAMRLIEEGRLTLDTTVSSILGEFRHPEVKIQHLLTHTSGLPADIHRAATLKSREEVLYRIYASDLINPVGKNIVYSDIGYMLLGLIIEKITGKTLDVLAEEWIFKPLEMHDTSYHPDILRAAPTEFRNDDVYTGLLKGKVHDEKAFAMGGVSGHAGLFSTTKDIAKFILSILTNDGKILKKATVDMLYPVRVKGTDKSGNDLVRSYGWNKPTKGGSAGDSVSFNDTILHTGFTGCNIWIERSKGIGFVMLSNAVHLKRENNRIIGYRNIIANMILAPEEV